MFSLRNKKKLSLNYPQYPFLSGALESEVQHLHGLRYLMT